MGGGLIPDGSVPDFIPSMAEYPTDNLLPFQGEVYYYGRIFSKAKSQELFELLHERVSWKPDEVIMFGKRIETSRKSAWYGDRSFEYTYSGITKRAELWFPELANLRRQVEVLTGKRFNSCLLNLYHNGGEGMGWHADNEPELGKNPVIASLSLGAERKFVFRHRTEDKKVDLVLENGSLLLMQAETQDYWLHSLPKSRQISEPRISLTFREIKK